MFLVVMAQEVEFEAQWALKRKEKECKCTSNDNTVIVFLLSYSQLINNY